MPRRALHGPSCQARHAGRCEAILDYIPTDGERITADGLQMIQEAGWKYNGAHWECAECLTDEREAGEIVMLCAIFPELMQQTPEEVEQGASRLLERLRAETNADRMEDVEAHYPMGDGGATYLDD